MKLSYDRASGRMAIDETELHCGDCFQINIEGKWHDVRIEHGSGWYLVGLPEHFRNIAGVYEGKEARFYS